MQPDADRKVKLDICVFGLIVPAVIAGVCVYLYHRHEAILHWLAVEDGPFEWATAVFYFAAAVLFVSSTRNRRVGRLWLVALGVLCFIVAGEEVSWGQRIFGFETPKAMEMVNLQQEFSIHNLQGIHQHVRALALLVVLTICLVIPVTNRYSSSLVSLYERLEVPIFPAAGIVWTLIAVAFMAVPRLVGGSANYWLDEIGETFLAAAFAAYGWSQAVAARRRVSGRVA